MRVHLSLKSSNVKTGPMPVSTTESSSCPDSCSLKNSGCYAKSGPLGIHWKMIDSGKRGTDWNTFCESIAKLPDGTTWRHNQAGDLPSEDNVTIDDRMLMALVEANKGKKGFTYTHYSPIETDNAMQIARANRLGFTINLSAESLQEADSLSDLNIAPVVTILPEDSAKVVYTPKGRRVVVCPATYRDDVSCYTCQLCQKQGNRAIVGFPVHGNGKKKAAKVFAIKSI